MRDAIKKRIADEGPLSTHAFDSEKPRGGHMWARPPHKLALDQICLEGAEKGRILNVGMQPHVMGQAWAVRAIREFVAYVKRKDHVWMPKREEIAAWYNENCADHIS